MKVLYVSHTGLMSGAEHALLDLLEALPAHVSPSVACPPGPLSRRLRATGVEVLDLPSVSGGFRLHPSQTPGTISELLRAARALRRVLDGTRPDVVHANSVRAGLVACCAQTARRAAVVLHSHDALPTTTPADLARTALRPVPDAVIAISDFVARAFAGSRFGGRVHVLHNPLDIERFDPAVQSRRAARGALGIDAGAQLLGVVAQITPWKGQAHAIRTLACLHKRYPELRLLIVGEAKFTSRATRFDNLAYLESLHRMISELGLQRHVEFWGERDDVETVFRALDVALTPSWEEPFGRSVIEAMAMGTPVVATNVGGPAEFVTDGVDGLLLPPREVLRWADTVARLLDEPSERAEIGRVGSENVRARFSRDVYAARVASVYEQALRAREVSRPRSASHSRARPSRRPTTRPPSRLPRMRIVFVEHSSIKSGGQYSLLELMQVLTAEHDVQLVCPSGPLAQTARARGFSVHLIPDSQLTFRLTALGTPRELARAWAARRAVRKHIERLAPEIVHANSLRAGLLVAGLRENAVVVHCRDLLPAGPTAGAVRRTVLSGSSAVVAVSETAAARFAGRGWARGKVSVVDNPVDTDRFDPARWSADAARDALGITGQPVLGLLAQITPWKGHTRAVRVLARLREAHPDARLVIAGEAKFVTPATRFDNQAYERELTRLVEDLGLVGAVHFLGERDDAELVIASLDVLLVPSTEEPFGRTVIEAMAMGVPVVATDAGGPAEIVRPRRDGVTLPPDDIGAWADAAAALARRGRRAESRAYAQERFTPERHAAAIVSIYDRVRANGQPRMAADQPSTDLASAESVSASGEDPAPPSPDGAGSGSRPVGSARGVLLRLLPLLDRYL